KIGPLYEELNQILVRQGILPDLDLSRYLSERKPRSEPPRQSSPATPVPSPAVTTRSNVTGKAPEPASAGGTRSHAFQAEATLARSAFETVRSLIGSLRAGRLEEPAQSPFAADAPRLSPGELQSRLQTLQSMPVPEKDARP